MRRIQVDYVGEKGTCCEQYHESVNAKDTRKVTYLKRKQRTELSFSEHPRSTE